MVSAYIRDSIYTDLRLTCFCMSIAAIVKSVNKTQRIVIVHEAPVTAGVGAEISEYQQLLHQFNQRTAIDTIILSSFCLAIPTGAHIQERCFLRLEAPVCRIGGWDTPFPLHEAFYKPEAVRILDGVSGD